MGFSICVRNITPIRTYEQADEHFNNTPKPRSQRWLADYRPLRDTRSTHLALKRGELNGVKYYDCELYKTTLVRYFEPIASGERAVWLTHYSSNSTTSFINRMGWWNGQPLVDEQGVVGHNIFASSNSQASMTWGDEFTSKLMFTADGKFMRDKSFHVPVFRRSSTATMRARRKKLREKFDVMLAIMEMQFSDLVSEHRLSIDDGEPFAGRHNPRHDVAHYYDASRIIRAMADGEEPTDDQRTILTKFVVALSEHMVGTLLNKRLYGAVVGYEGWRKVYTRNDFINKEPVASQPEDIQQVIIPSYKEVCSNVLACLVEMAGLRSDARVAYAQFPAAMPRTYYNGSLSTYLDQTAYSKLASRKGVIY